MGLSAFEEPDEGNFVDGGIDPDGFIRAMARLARSTTDTESIHLLLSSIRINQEDRRKTSEANGKFQSSNRKRHSEEDRRAGGKDDRNKRARRDVDRHVDNAKSAKGKRLVRIEAFECENCERFFATETALKTHKDSCAQATNAPKSKKCNCDLCGKERTNIYNHYGIVHRIEYPEQIMFYGGNVLVHSDIDTKGGKAPWFEKEEEKATKKYDNLTCRLCEAETKFYNSERLAVHYTLYHMVDPANLDNLKQLFRAEKGAHLVDLPTSQTPGKRKRATSNPTPDVPNPKYDKGNARFPCQQCKREYSTKSNLARHVKIAHLGKKPEVVVAQKLVSNENKKEKNTTKPGDRREPKSEKSKCALCDKEHSAIYKHYGNIHNIQDPEQLLFENGNVLVLSSIDTKGGKASWFLRQAENIKRYTSTTCRLCEVEYENAVLLENHYRSDHKVVPGALERLQYLFRAEKGAHLADLPASRTPCKQQKTTLPQRQGKTVSRGLTENTDSYMSAAEHTNQISEREIEKQDATVKTTVRNVQSESSLIEDSTAGSHQGNQKSIQILEDIPVSVFCRVCGTSITYSNFEAHAATHENYEYVEVETEGIQRMDDNVAQKQRFDEIKNNGHQKFLDILSLNDSIEIEGSGGGIVEPWNSDNDSCNSLRISSCVTQVDVHVGREEGEEINQTNQDRSGCRNRSEENGNKDATDYATIEKTSEINADSTHQDEQNSEINALATHQVKDTEKQEDWELWQDLDKDLNNLLGPGEIETCVDKSTPDKNTNTQELQEILETITTVQGTSEIKNDREEHAVIQNKNNDSIIYNRNNAYAKISQDIFSSERDPSEIHNENSDILELSQDMFSATTQESVNIDDINKSNPNENAHINTSTENDHGNAPNITLMENVGDIQPNPRPPTRDILCTLLEDTPSDVNAATEEERRNEEKRKIDQQYLVDETQRIREIMFSRD